VERDGTLVQRGVHVDPITLEPYTEPCDHTSCDVTVVRKYMVYNLIAVGCIDEKHLADLQQGGWTTKLTSLAKDGGSPLDFVVNFPIKFTWKKNTRLWSPGEAKLRRRTLQSKQSLFIV